MFVNENVSVNEKQYREVIIDEVFDGIPLLATIPDAQGSFLLSQTWKLVIEVAPY